MARSEMSNSTSPIRKYATVYISAYTMLPVAKAMAVSDIGIKNNGFSRKIIIKTEPLSSWKEKGAPVLFSCL